MSEMNPPETDWRGAPFDLDSRRLVLEGSPYECGLTHGETLRAMIVVGVEIWKDKLGKATRIDPEDYLTEFLSFTDYSTDIRSQAPDLWEELQGIAVGCGLDFNTVLAYQLIDEEWWYRSTIYAGKTSQNGTGCSALGIGAGEMHSTLLAQTMDLVDYLDGGQTLLHIRQDGRPEALVLTLAGMVGLNGMNRSGVGVCCNQLVQLESKPNGLPVAFVIRKVLQHNKLVEAGEFLMKARHASGQNYLIGSPQGLTGYECSAGKVVEYHPPNDDGWLYHTNHPLVNEDTHTFDHLPHGYSDEDRRALQRDTGGRLDFIQRHLEQSTGPPPDTIRAILSSRETPVCKIIDPGKDPDVTTAFTFGCVIMHLSARPRLEICFGPPGLRPFFQISFVDKQHP